MKSLWSDAEAAQFSGPLGPRVYTSRLLGRDKTLVLHGGGNTSVKLRENNLFGEDEEVLYVKGSGWDLETIEAAGFTPLALGYVRRLAALPRLSDPQMVNELNTHMLRAGAPSPSVETILHAILPHPYVDHTHADAVLSVSNAPEGEKRIREIYGERVVVGERRRLRPEPADDPPELFGEPARRRQSPAPASSGRRNRSTRSPRAPTSAPPERWAWCRSG